jgi:hypothetical protein
MKRAVGALPPRAATRYHEAPEPCERAEELQLIRGDVESDEQTLRGSTSRWFKVFLKRETPRRRPSLMSYTARLLSPPGMDFDLLVHEGDAREPSCGAPFARGAGEPEEVANGWTVRLSSREGRWLTLEVRHRSGAACGDEAAWTLTIAGNTGR